MNYTENDDFADDREIQQMRKERAEQEKLLNDCKTLVWSNLGLEETEDFTDISNSEITKPMHITEVFSYTDVEYSNSLEVLFCEYNWTVEAVKNSGSGSDWSIIGLLHLNKDYPLTYIYRETLRERIVNWFTKGDVDFIDSKRFSSKFHVVTKDEDKLKMLLYNKPLDELIKHPDIEIEINSNKCVLRVSKKPLSLVLAQDFCDAIKLLKRIFS